ncbi:hypothetical protein ABZ362_18610 [Streptomyces sp. NPDC005951]
MTGDEVRQFLDGPLGASATAPRAFAVPVPVPVPVPVGITGRS